MSCLNKLVVLDSEPVKSEAGALANVIKQYRRPLENGSANIDKVLPEYVAALKSAGVEAVIVEKRKQFNELLASKQVLQAELKRHPLKFVFRGWRFLCDQRAEGSCTKTYR